MKCSFLFLLFCVLISSCKGNIKAPGESNFKPDITTDQPRSTSAIYYNANKEIQVGDYGLCGRYALKEIYLIVYKFE